MMRRSGSKAEDRTERLAVVGQHVRLDATFADVVNPEVVRLAMNVLGDPDNGGDNELGLALALALGEQEGNPDAQREILRQFVVEADAVLRTLSGLTPQPMLITARDSDDSDHPSNVAQV
jgi:hypothetical protein